MKEISLEEFFGLLEIIPEHHRLNFSEELGCSVIENTYNEKEVCWTDGMRFKLKELCNKYLVKFDSMLWSLSLRDFQVHLYIEFYVF